jgi:hypothetical protein
MTKKQAELRYAKQNGAGMISRCPKEKSSRKTGYFHGGKFVARQQLFICTGLH